MAYRVVVTDFLPSDLDLEREVLGDVAEVEALQARTEEELVGRIEHADAVMVYHTLPFREKTIDRLQQCRLIVRCGVGYDNVAWQHARERGIPVANVPSYGTEEVADSAIGLMLSLTRNIVPLNSMLREGGRPWDYTVGGELRRLRGRVFGVIGLGRIGTAAALRAKAFGMQVIYYDPYQTDGYDKAAGVRQVETLDELLAQSYVVSLHCPLTAETRQIIGAAEMAKMPRGSYLVNTSRGAVVDTAAVAPALASGHLAGVGLDVLPAEPPREDDPLLQAWRDPQHPAHYRLILNPHVAFYSEEGLVEMRQKGAKACRKALLKQRIPNIVNGL